MLYAGNVGKRSQIATLMERGMGRMVTAAQWRNPEPGMRWALDNGAFSDYLQGVMFDGDRFERVLRKIPVGHRPDFGVVPDIVAGGLRSLLFSLAWLPRLPHGVSWYLAVQDGMTPKDVEPYALRFGGIFIGGTLEWKWGGGLEFIDAARRWGLPVHMGRVGTAHDLARAGRLGVDSVDSTTWAQNDDFRHVAAALAQTALKAGAGE